MLALPQAARADGNGSWATWNAARVTTVRGYPVFTVNGRPFFVYGAAFFYERMPRDRWRPALLAYKRLGINTIDLYVIWNWHEPEPGVLDFTGSTDPGRDLGALLKLTHELGFRLILRPGPVIRNEWRNGGYPAWLLQRAEYDMPLHDVLEGRYPATATLQNAHADAAAAQWLGNGTHVLESAKWLHDALRFVEPYSHDVVAIALDDDQGAYLDNDTWPAPHWHAYVDWLRATVQSVAGNRVPLFVNTYEMKVPGASPAWAWGNWYQGGSERLSVHDLADLDFATGLLQTQRGVPVMQSEFQAGWLQGADEGAPRPSDPSSTALALGELLRDGAHGIVNFPAQDTIYPHGWEAPWANWSYGWDAALTVDLRPSARYAPTAQVGDAVRAYGALLAKTHVAADAAIVWPPSLFVPGSLTNADFAAFAAATIAMQRTCNARGLTCVLADVAGADDTVLRRYRALLLPIVPSSVPTARLQPWASRRIAALQREAAGGQPGCGTRRRASRFRHDAAAGRRRVLRVRGRGEPERRVANGRSVPRRAREPDGADRRVRSTRARCADRTRGLVARVARAQHRVRRAGRLGTNRDARHAAAVFGSRRHGDEQRPPARRLRAVRGRANRRAWKRPRERGDRHRAAARCDRSGAAGVVPRLHRGLHAPASGRHI